MTQNTQKEQDLSNQVLPAPKREAFKTQEAFEEAMGYWHSHVGRIKGLLKRAVPSPQNKENTQTAPTLAQQSEHEEFLEFTHQKLLDRFREVKNSQSPTTPKEPTKIE